jgi:hypothetical protein
MNAKSFLDKWAAVLGFAGGVLALILADPQSESYIVVVTIAVIFFLAWLYGVFVAQEAARQPPPPVMRPDPAALAPPPPLLQRAPAQDLAAFRAQEDQVLGSYGWVDKEARLVRIPIEEAMKLVAEKGLPVLSPAPSASPGGGLPERAGSKVP